MEEGRLSTASSVSSTSSDSSVATVDMLHVVGHKVTVAVVKIEDVEMLIKFDFSM